MDLYSNMPSLNNGKKFTTHKSFKRSNPSSWNENEYHESPDNYRQSVNEMSDYHNNGRNNYNRGYGGNGNSGGNHDHSHNHDQEKDYDHDIMPNYQDPVTKALMDNIMGKLPHKKQKISLYCDLCSIEFSSQVTLDMHLRGARHKKKILSKEILQDLTGKGEIGSEVKRGGFFKCDLCNVMLNSSQQFQNHLSGNKHKQKAAKLSNQLEDLASNLDDKTDENKSDETFSDNEEKGLELSAPPSTSASTDPPKIDENILKKMESSMKQKKLFACEVCNVTVNSEMQLQQHLSSKKHADKASGKKVAKRKTGKINFVKTAEAQETESTVAC